MQPKTDNQPLRILHLVNDVQQFGNGIVNAAVDLAIEQARNGHAVALASAGGAYVDLLTGHNVGHIYLPQRQARHTASALWGIGGWIRRNRTDIIHAHMMTGAVLGRVAALGTRTKVVTTVHNSWQRHAILMRAGHRVIANSDATRREMIARGIPLSKIQTVLNGTVGSERLEVKKETTRVALEHPAVLTVAGMYVRKGIEDLIRAAARLREQVPGVRVYLAGDGPDRLRLEQLAADLQLTDTVTFLGFIADVEQLMPQADVFVLASHAEPFGLVICEARSAGVPVVATEVGGIPEALDGGAAGLLVPAKDPSALAEALARVFREPGLRENLQRAASENLDRFHVRRVSAETLEVYRTALGRK